jgi:hypothetical protein
VRYHENGCPTLHGFRSVRTSDVNSKILLLKWDHRRILHAISRNVHSSKTATDGAASVVMAQTISKTIRGA